MRSGVDLSRRRRRAASRHRSRPVKPYVIFDKSAIQMLDRNEVEELTHVFNFVCVPPLMREIVSDLYRPPSRSARVPRAIVEELAARIGRTHLLTTPSFRAMALSNLYGGPVPMDGRIPIDTTAPNVRVSDDNTLITIDGTVEQQLWWRWGQGDFSEADQLTGLTWRQELAGRPEGARARLASHYRKSHWPLLEHRRCDHSR